MLKVDYSTIKNNLESYFNKVVDEQETIIVKRKNEENVVILSLEKYNEIEKFKNTI